MVAAAFPASASKIVVPTVEQTTRVIEQRPFDGLTTSEWVRNEAQSQIKDVQRQIVIGVTQGEGTEQILQRVRGTAAAQYEDGSFGRGRRNLQAVLMGAVAHTATQTRQQFRDFNLDVLQRVQWSCVLDAATCLECMSWHGQVFGLEEGPRPPLHVRCRCLMIPVGPGEAAEAQTFDEWLAEQEDEVVVEALGVRRARLFRAGALKVGDFTNSIGRTYTLKELREKEPWAFRAAGID
jgi:SPP1 gp7 family putative phage head morphogenesis protein